MKPRELILVICEAVATVLVPISFTVGGSAPPSTKTAASIGIVLALLTAMSLAVFLIRDHFDARLADLESRIENTTRVTPILFRDFYGRFRAEIEGARIRVDVSYLKNQPPDSLAVPTAARYYRDLPDLVARKRDVIFRRLARGSPANREWVKRMIHDFRGRRNFSLGILGDELPTSESGGAVAVQLVDNDKTYLLSVGQQNPGSEPDLEIRSADFNSVWQRYYNALWNESHRVIQNGQVEYDELEQCYPGLRGEIE